MNLSAPIVALLTPSAVVWLTPLWVLGIGALGGLLILGALWLLLLAVNRRWATEAITTVREGPLLPILVTASLMAVLGILGTFEVRDPLRMFASLQRMNAVGRNVSQTYAIDQLAVDAERPVAPGTPPDRILPLNVRRSELLRLTLRANGPASASPLREEDPNAMKLRPDEDFVWTRGELTSLVFPQEEIDVLYLRRLDGSTTQITVTTDTDVAFPEVLGAPVVAISLVAVVLLYFLQAALLPVISAVALATSKSEMAQLHFLIAVVFGCFLLLVFNVIPYNTFGEDIKVLKSTGLEFMKFLCIAISLWAACSSVADEIEDKTALTLLSKPVRRHEFIIGKLIGINWTALALFVMLGTWFLFVVSYKAVYDATETAREIPGWQTCYLEVVRTVPGMLMAFFETIVLASLGVALATRLPLVANLMVCATVYSLGHLTPLIVQSTDKRLEPVDFVAKLIATVIPNLDAYSPQAAIAQGIDIPYAYLGMTLLYCILFSTAATLLALVFFEDRDLA